MEIHGYIIDRLIKATLNNGGKIKHIILNQNETREFTEEFDLIDGPVSGICFEGKRGEHLKINGVRVIMTTGEKWMCPTEEELRPIRIPNLTLDAIFMNLFKAYAKRKASRKVER